MKIMQKLEGKDLMGKSKIEFTKFTIRIIQNAFL